MNWVDAAKGKTQASCPFEYAAQLTEVMLLGVVALRAGRKIDYDGANMRVTNVAGAEPVSRARAANGLVALESAGMTVVSGAGRNAPPAQLLTSHHLAGRYLDCCLLRRTMGVPLLATVLGDTLRT